MIKKILMKLGKLTVWCSLGTLGFLMMIVLLLGGLLFSNSGLNTILWGVQQALPQLRVESTHGAIFPQFSLEGVQFNDPELYVDAKLQRVDIAIDPYCFLSLSVCIRDISLQGLDFSLTDLHESSSEDEGAEPSEPIQTIISPIPINVSQIELNQIALNILGNKVDWQHFKTGGSFYGNRLTIDHTVFNDINLSLAESQQEPDTTATDSLDSTALPEAAPSNQVLPTIWIPFRTVLNGFELTNFNLEGETPLTVNRLEVVASTLKHTVTVEKLHLDMPQLSAQLSTRVTLDQEYPLELDSHIKFKETALPDLDLSSQQIKLKVDGSLSKLMVDSQLLGSIKANIKGQLQPLDPSLPFDIQMTKTALRWPLISGSEDNPSEVSDYQVDIPNLRVQGDLNDYQLDLAAMLKGEAIPQIELALKGKGSLEQVELKSLNVKTLDGEISGNLMANWAALPFWKANLALKQLQPIKQWPTAPSMLDGKLATSGALTKAGGWQIELPELNIKGKLQDYPLSIVGQLSAADLNGQGEIKLNTPSLVFAHGQNQFTVMGSVDKNWQLDIKMNFPNLAKTVPELSGNAIGNILLRGKLKAPTIDIDIALNQLLLQQNSIKQALLKGSLVFDNTDKSLIPKTNITLNIDKIVAQEQQVDKVKLSINGDEQQHHLNFEIASSLLSTHLTVNGGFALSDQHSKKESMWNGELSKAILKTDQGTWQLDHATLISHNIDKMLTKVQSHCWLQLQSKVCVRADIQAQQSGEIELSIQQFNFEQIKTLLLNNDLQLVGIVDGSIWFKWQENRSPQLKISLMLPEGEATALTTPLTLGWQTITMETVLKENKLTSRWSVDVINNGSLSGELVIADVTKKDKAINGKLVLTPLQLHFLQPLLEENSLLNAQAQSELVLTGSLLRPIINGQFKVDGIEVKGEIIPIDINAGTLNIDFKGTQAEVNSTITTPEGDLIIKGRGDWHDLDNWSTAVNVHAKELLLDIPPMLKAKIVPDVQLAITPVLTKVTGSIGIPWGRINVDKLPESAVEVSDDLVLVDSSRLPIVEENTLPMNIETAITISVGDDVRLSAFGLNGELIGKLNITQKDEKPFVIGEVNILNGTYRSFGQDLQIKEGKILMNGPIDQPYVSINAIRNPENTQDNVTAGVKVTGSADKPKITIFSEPPMPQANALSYLLRGHNIDSDSSGSMTTMLIGLSLAQSGKVVGEIGNALGVEDLQLDTEGSGDDSQVTVSGYIAPGLKVKYGVGIFNSVGEITVRYRLITNLYIEVVSGLDSAVDLLYQFEFK